MRLSFHFTLAQHLIRNTKLRDWFYGQSSTGAFIIVDNGAPEGDPVSIDSLIEVAQEIHADEVVLPDVLRDAEATISLTTNPKILRNIPHRRRFVVPQGKNWDEWSYCLTHLVQYVKPATIGVPKWLNELPGGRRKALEIIHEKRLYRRCNIHLLGAARPFFQEMQELSLPFVRSMDTALPIALAQQGLVLNTESPRVSYAWNQGFSSRLAERNIDIAVKMAQEAKCTYP
jgi:hypothetical protein